MIFTYVPYEIFSQNLTIFLKLIQYVRYEIFKTYITSKDA